MFSSYTVSFLTSEKISLASDTMFLKQKKSFSDSQSCFCVEKSKLFFFPRKVEKVSLPSYMMDLDKSYKIISMKIARLQLCKVWYQKLLHKSIA